MNAKLLGLLCLLAGCGDGALTAEEHCATWGRWIEGECYSHADIGCCECLTSSEQASDGNACIATSLKSCLEIQGIAVECSCWETCYSPCAEKYPYDEPPNGCFH